MEGIGCNLCLLHDINESDEMIRHQGVLRSQLNIEITTVCAYDEERGFLLIRLLPAERTVVSVHCRCWPSAPNLPLL